jgi:hypothetical protein
MRKSAIADLRWLAQNGLAPQGNGESFEIAEVSVFVCRPFALKKPRMSTH